MKFKMPEFVLGAAFTIALVLVGYTFAERVPPPSLAGSSSVGSETLWQRTIDDPVAFFTFVLALLNVGLVGATIGLYRAGERQIRATQSTADAAAAAAAAAKDANQLNRDQFVAAQRPWIVAEFVPGPLTFDANGGMTLITGVTIRNIGNSPATNVWAEPRLVAWAVGPGSAPDIRAIQRQMITERKNSGGAPWGRTIFPGHAYGPYQHGVSVGPEEVVKAVASERQLMLLQLIVVIAYTFLGEKAVHQTGYLFDVRRGDAPRPMTLAKNRWPPAIFVDEGDVPATGLILMVSPLEGDYAD